MTQLPLTLSIPPSHLDNHLFEATNILGGPLDADDLKTNIFPLLFFKCISDVYDEETKTALEESGGDEEYAHFPRTIASRPRPADTGTMLGPQLQRLAKPLSCK